MTSAKRVKRHIDQAVQNRDARAAVLIAEQIRNALDTVDEQPAAVIEALIEPGKHLQISGTVPKHRYSLRAAMIEYLEQRLHVSAARAPPMKGGHVNASWWQHEGSRR
jgi:MFS superfamily sulfate permease-like transporter